MTAPFAPGDVVQCVDDRKGDSPDWYCVGQSPVVDIKRGSLYRVTGIVPTEVGPGLLLDGEAPHTCSCCIGENGWRSSRFRKIDDEVEESFRLMLRSLKTPQPANRSTLAGHLAPRSVAAHIFGEG